MSLAERWSVTYTKQINKKRAVYQDGFLELQSSRRKVLLYDENDKLLDSRFTKIEDMIRSGETLKFDSHIVDVGEKCEGHEPGPAPNCQEKDKKVAGKIGTWRSQESKNNPISVDRKPAFGKKNSPFINLSPSQKIIRDFKKSELDKYGSSPKCQDMNNSSTTHFKISEMKNNDSSPSCLDITKSSTIEWQVMYTTQITQKAKKYHDGVLQLVVRGVSQRGQITLLAEDGTVLSHRHLKLSEEVRTGTTLVLTNYMVEVGQCRDDASSLKDSKVKTSSIDDVSLSRRVRKTMPLFNDWHECHGKAKTKTSPRKLTKLDGSSSQNNGTKSRCTTPTIGPKRSAHDILSILRKPNFQGDIKPIVKDSFQLHVSDIHSDIKNHTHAKDCNRSDVDEFKESTSDHDCSKKTIKSEAVEILDAEKCVVHKIEEDSQDNSSSFYLRSRAANPKKPVNDAMCTDFKSNLSSSASEDHKLVTPALDPEDQAPIVPTLPSVSHIKVKIEDTSEIKSGPVIPASFAMRIKEAVLDTEKGASSNAGVASSDCTSHDIISGVEGNTLKQPFNSTETNEFPSFDLGF